MHNTATNFQLHKLNFRDNLVSKNDKLEARLRRKPPPADFTWDELVTLMRSYGFDASCSGGGSHHRFFNAEHSFTAYIAKPHPDNVMKRYQIKDALEAIDVVSGS